MSNTFVSYDGAIMVLRTDGGFDRSYRVVSSASVTLNGDPSKFADLLPGDCVVLTGDPATAVETTREMPPAAKGHGRGHKATDENAEEPHKTAHHTKGHK